MEALLVGGNPLAPAGLVLPSAEFAPAIALRSGSIEPESDDEIERMDAARRTWSGEGRSRFDDAWRSLSEAARARGVALWLHPVAGDVFGDVPGLRALPTLGTAGVVLEPARLLTESMRGDAEDHFVRIVESAAGTGLVRAVVVTDLDDDGRRVRLGTGRLGRSALVGLLRLVEGLAPACLLAGEEA